MKYTNQLLCEKDNEAWLALVRDIDDQKEVDFAFALLQSDSSETWLQFAEENNFFTDRSFKRFRNYLRDTQIERASGDQKTRLRLKRLQSSAQDLFLEESTALLNENCIDDLQPSINFERMRRLLYHRQYDEAIEAGLLVQKISLSPRLRDMAMRRVASAYLHINDYSKAFDLYDRILQKHGPMFGGESVTVSQQASSPLQSAKDELSVVATWADYCTPEYVRAIGGLWELMRETDTAPENISIVSRCFELGLVGLNSEEHAIVVRQALQRGFLQTAQRSNEIQLRARKS